MNKSHYIGQNISSFESYQPTGEISGIRIIVDDETEIMAGDETGYVMDIECPYGTQEMAENLLSAFQGKSYHGYHADGAELDITAELGDGVEVNGIYSVLAYRNVAFGPGHFSEISAPGENEVDHEYPYASQTKKSIDRNMATTRALIEKTANTITLRVDGIDGEVSALQVTLDGVTITDESGTTRIKGSSIETESIAAGAITADKLTLTGSIKWADLSPGVQASMGDDNPPYIKSTYIDEAKIVSPEIYGGYFYATGQGADDGAAFYIYDGADVNGGNVTLGNLVGYLSYDNNGAGTPNESAERVFLTTLNGAALKLQSAAGMSLEAEGGIYVPSLLHIAGEIKLEEASYGDTEPADLGTGQLFFVWEDSINGYKAVIG